MIKDSTDNYCPLCRRYKCMEDTYLGVFVCSDCSQALFSILKLADEGDQEAVDLLSTAKAKVLKCKQQPGRHTALEYAHAHWGN